MSESGSTSARRKFLQQCKEQQEQQKLIDKRFDKVLKSIGGYSYHQLFITIMLVLFNKGVHLVIMNLSYLEKVPKEYFCTYEGSEEPQLCYPADFCTDPTVTSYTPNMELRDSYDNWVGKLDLACASKAKVGLIGSAYFAGWILTLLFIPRFSDL